MKDLSNENIIHIQNNGIEYIQFKRLLEYKDILVHGYSIGRNVNFRTLRVGENMDKENVKNGIENYKNLCNSLNLDYRNIVKTNQTHTNNVKIISKKINKDEPDINLLEYKYTDGLITNKKGLILSTTNADCILLLFFDPIKKVIANVHSGWRGTLKRIAVKTIEKMEEEYNSKPENIIVCISPSIRKCHFEVDEDVKDLFEKEFKEFEKYKFIEKQENKNKWNIDTVYLNKEMLISLGIKETNIIDSKICTVCNKDKIHSYRVEKQEYGLETAIIALK